MSEALFDVPPPRQAVLPRVTERRMLDLLRLRYSAESMGARRYAFAEHPANNTSWAQRVADAIAIDCYGRAGGRGVNQIHGHEIKVSRSDWLAELCDPTKAGAFRPYCHRWWLVVPSRAIVADGELPEGWGLMEGVGRLRAVVQAPALTPEPMPPGMIAALMRATAKTARNESREAVR